MRTLPVLDDLPSSYTIDRADRGVAAVHDSTRVALAQVGWGAVDRSVMRPSSLRGRKPLFELDTAGETLLVRRFSHGGLLRWATGERFRDPERPFREIVLSEHLHEHGIRTARVVAARARAAPAGTGWYLEVITRRVAGASDLGIQLAELQRGGKRGAPETTARARLLFELGRLVSRLHGCGFLHADLNPNNILVELASLSESEPRLWVLDLDRSQVLERLTDEQRWSNIGRLFRHVDRREGERGRALGNADYRRFFRGYGLEGDAWKRYWRAIESAQAGNRWHRIGWRLERRFGGPDPRGSA
ncbi:MAG: hypothetical protein ACI8QZ_003657 [Chlamydiales bacterium]|jgi:hypothetical protein